MNNKYNKELVLEFGITDKTIPISVNITFAILIINECK